MILTCAVCAPFARVALAVVAPFARVVALLARMVLVVAIFTRSIICACHRAVHACRTCCSTCRPRAVSSIAARHSYDVSTLIRESFARVARAVRASSHVIRVSREPFARVQRLAVLSQPSSRN